MEALLDEGFTPMRTIILGFGIDEESAGTEVSPWCYLCDQNGPVAHFSDRVHHISPVI